MRKLTNHLKRPRFYLRMALILMFLVCLTAPALAADDLWTIANNLIVDLYNHIAGISTVLAGLQQPTQSGPGVGLAQTYLDLLGHHQRDRGVYCLHHSPVQRPGYPHSLTRLCLRGGAGNA